MNQYQVKKERHAVAVFLSDGLVLEGAIFLAQFAARHQGSEQVLDLMLEEEIFFPLQAKDGSIQLINKWAVTHIRWTPLCPPTEVNATERPIHLTFIGGDTLDGVLRAVLPSGQERVQDFLNLTDDFFTLDAGDYQYVINRRQVRQLTSA